MAHPFPHRPGFQVSLLTKAFFSLALSRWPEKSQPDESTWLRLARLSCPTYFYGITQTGFLDAKALQKIIADLPQGASEIMCHPGYVDTELSSTPTRLLSQREAELQALIQPEIKQLIAECGIELISYRNLAELS